MPSTTRDSTVIVEKVNSAGVIGSCVRRLGRGTRIDVLMS